MQFPQPPQDSQDYDEWVEDPLYTRPHIEAFLANSSKADVDFVNEWSKGENCGAEVAWSHYWRQVKVYLYYRNKSWSFETMKEAVAAILLIEVHNA